MVVVYGLLYGCIISLCFSFGPAFFTLLQTSVKYGFKKAYPIAFGINANDIIVVTLLLSVFSNVDMQEVMHRPLAAAIGSLALLAFGLYTILGKRQDASSQGTALNQVRPITIYMKGLTINMINPMIWIFWAGFVTAPSLMGSRFNFTIPDGHMWLLFVGVLSATLLLDMAKCKLASLLQPFLTARMLKILNIFIGLVLCGFAVYLAMPVFALL